MASPSAASVGRNRNAADIGDAIARQLTKHVLQLLDMIRSRRWTAFEGVVLAMPNAFRMMCKLCQTVPNVREFRDGATLLHVVLRHDPPARVVAKMMALLPDVGAALRAADDGGRTPLHVAAACDADPLVVRLLSGAEPAACDALDEDSRAPLHLACDGARGRRRSILPGEGEGRCRPPRRRPRAAPPSHGVVCALLSDSLRATLLEDDEGMNALEHAIMSGASVELVALLQRATMEACREREKQQRSATTTSKKRPTADDAVDAGKRRRIG